MEEPVLEGCKCEETCADAAVRLARRIAQIETLNFIFLTPTTPALKEWGEISLSPGKCQLEGGRDGIATVHFVRFATVASAAELRRLVGAAVAGARVIGATHEEHRGVVPRRQSGVAGLHLHHVHQVLVVAGGALYRRLRVVREGAE